MPGYVFDTSALICFLDDEDGADQVEQALSGTDTLRRLVPYIALMEVEYRTLRRGGPHAAENALRILQSWPVEFPESNPVWRREASRLKAVGSLSLADAWIAALALLEDAHLVHKDPEYDGIPDLQALRLPDKERPRRRR